MRNNPLISLIIPVYKVENYITSTIESAISQTYKNIEIIIVNDGSPDKSGDIADKYAETDSRIRVIHKENQGVSIARNTAIDAANGEYVCFLDADDILDVDYVEYLYSLVEKYDTEVAMSSDVWHDFTGAQAAVIKDRLMDAEIAARDMMLYKIRTVACFNKIYKKTLIDDRGIRFLPQFFMGEGFTFNIRIFRATDKVAIGNKKIYHYISNPSSVTRDFSLKQWVNGFEAIKYMDETSLVDTPKLKLAWNYARWHTYYDALRALTRSTGKQEYQNEYKAWKRIVRNSALWSLVVPISMKDRIHSIISIAHPLPEHLLKLKKGNFIEE